ncbi:hypothetical protein JCM10908_001875 [Rhodotorula pacifica]|uniref:uncharacterized protein n=1 Tax=Rhodotorula pacifica TaxID=1495444 RepID=UPI00317378E4
MHHPAFSLLCCLSLFTFASALPHASPSLARRAYPLPDSDPFYVPPPGYATQSNGAVLNSRQVSTAFDAFAKSTYQVLYKTTAATGEADATVAVLFAPLQAANPPRIMILTPPTDSPNPNCATSAGLVGGPAAGYNNLVNAPDIIIGLTKGWYVVVPDDQGSKAAFISGLTEALAALDSLRALLNFKTTLPDSTGYKAVLHGYSGGGHASAWATQFVKTYGSPLNIIAAAYGGVPVALDTELDFLSSGAFASLGTAALAGLGNAFPDLEAWLQNNTTPAGKAALNSVRTDNSCNSFVSMPGVDVYSYFTNGRAALSEPIPQKYIQAGLLGSAQSSQFASASGVLPIPVFQYHSSSDEIVTYEPIPAYYADQCARGATLQLSTTIISEHLTADLLFLGDAYIYLENAFNGLFANGGCSRSATIVAPIFSPAYIAAVGMQAWSKILSLNGANISGEKVSF